METQKETWVLQKSKEYYFYTEKNFPVALCIIPSSFVGLYNVIREDGEFDVSEFHPTLTPHQILEDFGVDIVEANQNRHE